jgi:hypothetical protein
MKEPNAPALVAYAYRSRTGYATGYDQQARMSEDLNAGGALCAHVPTTRTTAASRRRAFPTWRSSAVAGRLGFATRTRRPHVACVRYDGRG